MYLRSLVLFCWAWALAANAQVESVSLQEAIEIALENSYSYQAAQKNTEITQNNNNYGQAGRYPSLSFNINSQNSYNNINNPTSFLNGASILGTGGTASLDLSWTLFDGFKVRINKHRLDLLETQSKGNAKLIIENTVAEVMRAYYNAQVQQKRRAMQKEVLHYSRDKIAYISAKREFGQAVTFDSLQIMDAYLNDSIQWVLQDMAYQTALQNLAAAMGLDLAVEQNAEPSDSLTYLISDYNFEELREELLGSNQQLRNEKLKEQLAKVDIDLQKSNLYPRLSLNAGVSEQLSVSQVSGKQPVIPDTWQAGTTFTGYANLSLAYTIYNGGSIKRAISNSKIQQEIARLNSKNLERQLSQQLQVLLTQYHKQETLFGLSQQLKANALRNLEIAEERFGAGTLNFFDFRTIQISYIRSINALQDAFLNIKNTEIELLLRVGNLIIEN